MTKHKNDRNNRQKKAGVNPQGLTEEKADQQPFSQLEAKAKKDNTKR
ncbi:small, acid-soluble spore protein L [Paraliobacillus salinarum]|nr:small, acid-soluble spore protein L [Paraliobacillus salinarum]